MIRKKLAAQYLANSLRGISIAEKLAVRHYISEDGCKEIQGALRLLRPMIQITADRIEAIDWLLDRHPLPHPTTVYRRATSKFFGTTDAREVLTMQGRRFTENGFMSSTPFPRYLNAKYGEFVVVVNAPKGIPAAYIAPLAPPDDQDHELLLGRGLEYKITRVGEKDGRVKVTISVLGG